ncbi:MarR family winged helix-turn-helix transcriptional regulator [Kineosporia succinea]|uniref:DNA-binding MarR family transcriptional regulator n=1 Tax=Kineosporia succinea TaxID=84632 RepID=A0ABT9NYC0_9ACTN|nr:MarR family winged helix-turn-helix transcriptional regulator [Kineosporia succinea]MDP9825301.1 DNA-binding MarR family transcriptional regulator [Kineosporia succinea]
MPVTATAVSDLFHQLQSVGRSMKALAGKEADRLSFSNLMVLSQVESCGEVRSSGLADLLGVDHSVVSRQLAVLEAAGLTARRPDPQDGRAWLAHVTPAGSERLADMRAHRVAQVTNALGGWSDDEARQLCAQLVRLDEALQQTIQQNEPASHRGDPTANRAAATTGETALSSKGKVHA